MRRIWLCVWLLLLALRVSGSIDGDSTRRPVYLGLKVHKGFILPHRKDLREVSDTYPWGFQLDISRYNISKKSWSTCNCYARTGFSFAFFDYNNPEVLGNSYNLIYFAEPQFGVNKRFHFSFRSGFGVTYLNRVYDAVENPLNQFYSSKISFMLLLNLTMNYSINPNWNISLSGFYNHISNGGISQPNKGMNFPTLAIGVDYILRPLDHPLAKRLKELELDRRLKKYARVFWSIRTVNGDSLHPEVQKLMIGLAVGIMKPLSKINALSLGAEFSHDGSFKEKAARSGESWDHHVISVMLSHNFTFGRVIFNQEFAYYAYRPFPSNENQFFQRYGLYYLIGKWINLGFSLKAHGAVAEHMDIRIGALF